MGSTPISCHQLDGWPWANHLISPSLSFLIHNTRDLLSKIPHTVGAGIKKWFSPRFWGSSKAGNPRCIAKPHHLPLLFWVWPTSGQVCAKEGVARCLSICFLHLETRTEAIIWITYCLELLWGFFCVFFLTLRKETYISLKCQLFLSTACPILPPRNWPITSLITTDFMIYLHPTL